MKQISEYYAKLRIDEDDRLSLITFVRKKNIATHYEEQFYKKKIP